MPAGIVFAVALLVVAAAAGWRPGRPAFAAVGLGAVGGGTLVGAWLLSHGGPGVHVAPVDSALALWTPVVALVAVAEEVALRGALFNAVRSWSGDGGAVVVTTFLFAAMHVPLYGIGSSAARPRGRAPARRTPDRQWRGARSCGGSCRRRPGRRVAAVTARRGWAVVVLSVLALTLVWRFLPEGSPPIYDGQCIADPYVTLERQPARERGNPDVSQGEHLPVC